MITYLDMGLGLTRIVKKLNNYKLPAEWIDRIFLRLAEIYGDKFASKFTKPEYVDMEKLRWQAGLFGVTADEIKHVVTMCHQGNIKDPPNVVEFYHYCKGIRKPNPIRQSEFTRTETQQKTGEKYIKLIMDKLYGRIDSEGEAALSALDKQVLSKQNDKNTHWQDDKA